MVIPDCSVADEEIDTGSEAECFADYMRIHALESTGGKVYAEMPRAVFEDTGKPVPEEEVGAALEDGNGDRQSRATGLGDRDGAGDGDEHVLLRGAGIHVRDCHGNRHGRDWNRTLGVDPWGAAAPARGPRANVVRGVAGTARLISGASWGCPRSRTALR